MPSFTGKKFSDFYKNILSISQSSNTGVDATTRQVEDGDGNNTCFRISDDRMTILPQNDNMTNTLGVGNTAGNECFAVDTVNETVKIGRSGTSANTQYAHFGIHGNDSGWAGASADTHYAVPFTPIGTLSTLVSLGSSTSSSFNDTNPATSITVATTANYAMGTSTTGSFNDTNPATTLTISDTAMSIVRCYWYVMDNITIDAVKWLHAADTATGEATAGHLLAYTVDIANGSTSGDLSAGVVVADGANITNAGYELIYYQSMTIQSADVDAGKVILFTFASDTVNSDYSLNCSVKYHIR